MMALRPCYRLPASSGNRATCQVPCTGKDLPELPDLPNCFNCTVTNGSSTSPPPLSPTPPSDNPCCWLLLLLLLLVPLLAACIYTVCDLITNNGKRRDHETCTTSYSPVKNIKTTHVQQNPVYQKYPSDGEPVPPTDILLNPCSTASATEDNEARRSVVGDELRSEATDQIKERPGGKGVNKESIRKRDRDRESSLKGKERKGKSVNEESIKRPDRDGKSSLKGNEGRGKSVNDESIRKPGRDRESSLKGKEGSADEKEKLANCP